MSESFLMNTRVFRPVARVHSAMITNMSGAPAVKECDQLVE